MVNALPLNGFRILVVEDNPHIVEMYSYALKKLAANSKDKRPIEIEVAGDGHSALAQLSQSEFSLVLTDLYMPVMDGFALVLKIRSDQRLQNLPVVAISGGGKDAQDRALQVGVDVYLQKPVKFVEVLATVKQLLHLG